MQTPAGRALAGLMLQAWIIIDKNSLLGEVNIQKRKLCVKGILARAKIFLNNIASLLYSTHSKTTSYLSLFERGDLSRGGGVQLGIVESLGESSYLPEGSCFFLPQIEEASLC
jgi:hypothetical protein